MGSKVAPWEGQMGFKASSAWLKLSLNQQWLWQRWKLGHRGCVKVKVKVAQSCPTLCKPPEMGKQWKQCHFLFWAPKSLQMVIAAMKLKDAYSLEGKL